MDLEKLEKSKKNLLEQLEEQKKLKKLKKKTKEESAFSDKFGNNMAKGGRVGYKPGMRVCKLAKKGKGKAYGKNS